MKLYSQIIFVIFFIVSAFSAIACAPVLIGGAAAAGYMVITKDYVTASVDASYTRVWGAASDEVRTLGAIEKSFRKLGEISGTVQGSKVKVKISKLTERTVDIKVAVRTNLLPNSDLAQSILAAILRKLK